MKLHIGCGKKYLPGYVHVDITPHKHVDIVCNLLDIDKHVPPSSVDEIYACHCAEHVSRHEITKLFKVFYKVLKPNGVLRLSVPDIEQSIKMYMNGTPLFPTLYGQFWGGQKDDYDYHTCGFDMKTMRTFLQVAGFDNVERYDWREFLPEGFDDYSRSYIPHMDFENGTLLSLNVVARKRRPIIVYCTGGFTNAINSLIASVNYARQHHMKIFLYWIDGYVALDSKFTDIFDIVSNYDLTEITDDELVNMLRDIKTPVLKITHNTNITVLNDVEGPVVNPKHVQDLPNPNDYNMVFFHTDEAPFYVQSHVPMHFSQFFKVVSFRKSIIDDAFSYLKSFVNVPKSGLHLRGTDILSTTGFTYDDIINFASTHAQNLKDKELPLLICTDDKIIAERITLLNNPNMIICNHKDYVKKCNDNVSWYHDAGNDHINANKFEVDGKQFKAYSSANVYRSHDQIKAGIIDLILLSNMHRIDCFGPTSGMSTYYKFAKMLQIYNYHCNSTLTYQQ